MSISLRSCIVGAIAAALTLTVAPSAGAATAFASASMSQASAKAVSTVTLAMPRSAQFFMTSDPAPFTASVKLSSGASASGSVAFKVNGKTIKSVKVRSGKAVWSMPKSASVGVKDVTATFVPSSSSTVAGDSSPAREFTVRKATSKTAVKPSMASYRRQAPASLVASVSLSGGATVTGKIVLTGSKAKPVTKAISGGKVTLRLAVDGPVGKQTVTAKFVPTNAAGFAGSTSAKVTINVMYNNCSDVWRSIGRPISKGEAGFGAHLDSGGKPGVGCETPPSGY